MKEEDYSALYLKNQLCFPLYACSREVIKRYKPQLDKLDLTYTQYVVMLVLWEESNMTVKELGKRLYLDSGTLTPLLKKLEHKGLICRNRSIHDERNLRISLTETGEELKKRALPIRNEMAKEVTLSPEEARSLYDLLYKLLEQAESEKI